ncbi:hypothetical protein BDZ91DRAFT_739599 [Kalaharituber pfeilii]|nr:hypothetical protein BDZ91DRAFT_739599 [Kalaharituber pfeilii]
MAELNSHDFLTPDLLLAIGIAITEYMLLFTIKLLCRHQHCKEMHTYRRSIFQQTRDVLWKVHFARSSDILGRLIEYYSRRHRQ